MKKLLLVMALMSSFVVCEKAVFADTVGEKKILQKLDELPPAWGRKIDDVKQRFVVLEAMKSEAVLDKETGLVWEKSPDTTKRTWVDATTYVSNKTGGGRKGWRLPTIEELASLVDPTQSNPALPKGHPFIGVQVDAYWSSTTSIAYSASHARLVDFHNGTVYDYGKTLTFYVWCVRGGHGYDAQ